MCAIKAKNNVYEVALAVTKGRYLKSIVLYNLRTLCLLLLLCSLELIDLQVERSERLKQRSHDFVIKWIVK